MKHDTWRRVAEYGGRSLNSVQLVLLDRYAQWLASEGLEAGGIGPAEVNRLETRHIGDSLSFAVPFGGTPDRIWDLGSGVGLPGIPLAILIPETEVILVDRSARRTALARRAVRVLDLGNVETRQIEIGQLQSVDLAVSRATLPPEEMAKAAHRWLEPGGMVVQGGSWQTKPDVRGWDTQEIPDSILDYTVWLLIMRRRD